MLRVVVIEAVRIMAWNGILLLKKKTLPVMITAGDIFVATNHK